MLFRYTVTDPETGTRRSEKADAASLKKLTDQLKEKGYKNIRIQKLSVEKVKVKRAGTGWRIPRKELIVFTRQLATALEAGLVLTDSLETVSKDLENDYFHDIIENIRHDVISGTDFSTALSRYGKVFPKSYSAIVKAGEATGLLYKTLGDLAQYLEDTERLREKVKVAVSYPLFVLFFAIFVVLAICVLIIPQFKRMFSDFGAELPLFTRMIVTASEYLLRYGLLILAAVFLAFVILVSLKKVRFIQRAYDVLRLKIPVIGRSVFHKSIVARFCWTMGFLLEAGVPLSQALNITGEIVHHIPMQESVQAINDHIIAGGMISEKIRDDELFPNLVYKMVSVGEKSGKMNDMLKRTARAYEEEIEFALMRLTSLLEPVLIIFVGGIIFTVVVALYLPIFQLSEVVK
ncbi:MAG: type II secretion system F family protein [Candidatus Omnitrophica bacterium]|nr:type II secretion system F family protein [Candidatus Omnitrophota bacterium]